MKMLARVHQGARPLWADLAIAILIFWAVLLPLEFGGGGATTVAVAAAIAVLAGLEVARIVRGRR